MATITTINSGDQISSSRSVINTNFANLNSDKIETSYIDTDTTLAANSDSKIPSQKAVKAYVDTGGNVNASETNKGIVEEATDAEVTAGTATGGTGAKLFITPAKLATRLTNLAYVKTILYKTGTTTHDVSTTGTQNIAHGMSTTPTRIKISAVVATNKANYVGNGSSTGVYDGTTTSSIYEAINIEASASTNTGSSTNGSSSSNVLTLYTDIANGKYATATVTVDATNIVLTWSKTSTPTGTASIIWEAFGSTS